MSDLSIYIAAPAYGGWIRNACAQSLMQTAVSLSMAGVRIGGKICNIENITQVRNMYGSLMLEQQFTHLLFVDYDIAFGQETVTKLIKARKPIVGAVYPFRKIPIEPNVWAEPIPVQPLAPVLGIPMGLALIETQVFRRLADTGNVPSYDTPEYFKREGLNGPVFRFFDHLERDGEDYSEDYSFCIRWREMCGGEIWALSGEPVGHIGEHIFQL